MKPTRDMLVFQLEDMTADRDRWKERCEAAENVIYCCTTPPWTVEDYWNSYKLWERIKSEMEAGDETR